MRTKKITDLLEGIDADIPENIKNLQVNEIHYDSRKVQNGDLFVAVRGFKSDGHGYISAVEKAGAAAAVVENVADHIQMPQIRVTDSRSAMAYLAYNYYRPEIEMMNLIGITGTNGKTTTSFLVRSMLEQAGIPSGLIGTIAYYYGDHQNNAWNTTPEALDLCKLIFDMYENKQQSCVLEVSSHALSLNRVDSLPFKVAVFTNLSRDHMDFYKNEDEYFTAKVKLFSLLRDDGIAVINIDDKHGSLLARQLNRPMLTFAVSAAADVCVKDWQIDISGIHMQVESPAGSLEIHSKLLGEFNLQNILAAVAVGIALDIELKDIAAGIENLSRVPGRFESYPTGDGALAVIDYAHSPDALEKALLALRKITGNRLIVLFGAGGDRDRGKRPIMGKISENLADWIIVTSDNPRTEDPDQIINEILEGMSSPEKREVISDRRKAIEKAVKMSQKGDVVLIAGKGHEMYQEINGVKYDFDEASIVKEASQHA